MLVARIFGILSPMPPVCAVHWLGLVPYQDAWQLQVQLAGEIAANKRPPTLLLLEHPHTFTFGRRGRIENLLWDENELFRRGVSVHWTDRGGDVTYHGPGQLVGYPLLPLGSTSLRVDATGNSTRMPQADYVGYLRKLEIMLITALARFGVTGEQVPGLTGVWLKPYVTVHRLGCPPEQEHLPAKIAAIGVKVDACGISQHGFALNVNPDMSFWQGIIGCGLINYPITCLADILDPVPTMEQVIEAVLESFGEVFTFEMLAEMDHNSV